MIYHAMSRALKVGVHNFLEVQNVQGAQTEMTPFLDLFSLCPPPQYVMRPPVSEHVSLHSKSLSKNMARASGGCKYAPTKLEAQKEMIPFFLQKTVMRYSPTHF